MSMVSDLGNFLKFVLCFSVYASFIELYFPSTTT